MSATGMEGGSSATIIVVDDDFMNLKIAERLLRNEYEVILAKSGNELFQHLKKITPDLILLDVFMPEMDGYASAKAIRALDRQDAKTVRIFACSANCTEEDRQRAFDSGMDDFLAKPVDIDILLQKLSE